MSVGGIKMAAQILRPVTVWPVSPSMNAPVFQKKMVKVNAAKRVLSVRKGRRKAMANPTVRQTTLARMALVTLAFTVSDLSRVDP